MREPDDALREQLLLRVTEDLAEAAIHGREAILGGKPEGETDRRVLERGEHGMLAGLELLLGPSLLRDVTSDRHEATLTTEPVGRDGDVDDPLGAVLRADAERAARAATVG